MRGALNHPTRKDRVMNSDANYIFRSCDGTVEVTSPPDLNARAA